MEFQLKQRGRASLHFLSDLAVSTSRFKSRIDADIKAAGLDESTMADDLDDRLRQVDAALAESPAAAALAAAISCRVPGNLASSKGRSATGPSRKK